MLFFFFMIFQTVDFDNPIVWPMYAPILFLFLSITIAFLIVIGTTLVLMLTNSDNGKPLDTPD